MLEIIERILERILASPVETIVILVLSAILLSGPLMVIFLLRMLSKLTGPAKEAIEQWGENEKRRAALEIRRDEERERLRERVTILEKSDIEKSDDLGNKEAKIKLYSEQLLKLEKSQQTQAAALLQEREDRRRESEEKQKTINDMQAEISSVRRQLEDVQNELVKARAELKLRNEEIAELIKMNKRITIEREAEKQEMEKRVTDLEALSAKLAGQHELAVQQRDAAILEASLKEDRIKIMEQQFTELQGRLGKIEIQTGPLMLPEPEEKKEPKDKAA